MLAQLKTDYVGASKFSALLSAGLHRVLDFTSRGLPKHRPDFPAFRIAKQSLCAAHSNVEQRDCICRRKFHGCPAAIRHPCMV